jgi:hypothetical protein
MKVFKIFTTDHKDDCFVLDMKNMQETVFKLVNSSPKVKQDGLKYIYSRTHQSPSGKIIGEIRLKLNFHS